MYRLFYKDEALLDFIDIGTGQIFGEILPINVHGIHHINMAEKTICHSCPVEDVRIELNGVPVVLSTAYTFTVNDVVSWSRRWSGDKENKQ